MFLLCSDQLQRQPKSPPGLVYLAWELFLIFFFSPDIWTISWVLLGVVDLGSQEAVQVLLVFAHAPFVEALDGHGDVRVLGRQCWGRGKRALSRRRKCVSWKETGGAEMGGRDGKIGWQ